MEGLTEAQLKECYVKPGKGTKGYCFHEIMLQTKKPKEALRFYSEPLGMRLLYTSQWPSDRASYYYLGYEEDENNIPRVKEERLRWCIRRKSTIELEHKWDSESDTECHLKTHSFGHIGITVPDLPSAFERFKMLNVPIIENHLTGKHGMKYIYIQDPDGHLIEVFDREEKQGE